MKGYVKAQISEEEIQFMRAKIYKATGFMNKWFSGEYKTKKVVKSFLFFTKNVTETDYKRAHEDAKLNGCDMKMNMNMNYFDADFIYAELKPETQAYSRIISLVEIGDAYLDNELALCLKEIRQELKNERN